MIPNRTMFSASPFGMGDYTKAMVQAPVLGAPRTMALSPTRATAQPRVRLGQGIEDLAEQAVKALTDVDGLLRQLPVNVAGEFSGRRDACLEHSVWNPDRYSCLIRLGRDIRDALKGEGNGGAPVPTPTPTPTPPESEFPWVPVAIGTVAVGAIVYAVVSKGTGKKSK